MKKNQSDQEIFEPFDKSNFEQYIQECKKNAYKKLHNSHMYFFTKDLQVPLARLEKVLKTKTRNEVNKSILNSPLINKPKNIKRMLTMRSCTQQSYRSNKSFDKLISRCKHQNTLRSLSTNRDDIPVKENKNYLDYSTTDKKGFSIYDKFEELKNKKHLNILQNRNTKMMYESLEIRDKPIISVNSKMIISNREPKKPIYMRVWEDEEIKENKLINLKKTIEEKNYFSEININPIRVQKCQNTQNNSNVEKAQRFENWLETNKKWNHKRQTQRQLLYEMKQNEMESSVNMNNSKNKLSSIDSNIIRNKSFIERLSNDNTERKVNLEKLKNELCPSFKAKINNKLPIYLKNNKLNNSFNNISHEDNLDKLIKNAKYHRSNNTLKTSSTKSKTLTRSKSTNNFPNCFPNLKNKYNPEEWKKKIHNVNRSYIGKSKLEEKLYKINVYNSSAWDKSKGSNVVFDPRLSNLLSSLAKNNVVDFDECSSNRPEDSNKTKNMINDVSIKGLRDSKNFSTNKNKPTNFLL
jgi:hypothetical protein